MTHRSKTSTAMLLAQLATMCIGWSTAIAPAHALNLAQAPLYLTASQPPLIMMTMARDHKLYYEAYNDYSDLDGDGTLDLRYNPDIEYYGYFDSYKCYNYTDGIFTPVAVTANKKCTGGNDTYWSGDFLNYVTTSRMDALRKVFYGGKRSTDTATKTVLERAFIPQDAHSWGKEYESIARDGYDIREYSPLALPVAGYRHLLANVTLTSDTSPPLLRVLNDSAYRIWEWVSIERPVAGSKCLHGSSGPNCETSGSSWQIVPASGSIGLSGLTITTYHTGTSSHPVDMAAFNTFEGTYATNDRKCGTAAASTIDGTGNPFAGQVTTSGATCGNDNYLTIFEGTLNVPSDGTYRFGIDGDDAIDLYIDGTQRVGWYGGHGASGTPEDHSIALTLAAGTHSIKFRHEEGTGSDSYRLYWKPSDASSVITDYNVRVEVCKTISGVDSAYYEGRESNCQSYGTSPVIYKPTGLLHKYGQNNGMYFGLITGSYDQNTEGGVLRKEVSSITNEIEATTGIFKETGTTCGLTGGDACTKGIVGTINRLKITSFNYDSQQYSCGWITTRAMNNGECEMWGNPLGEMMYEGLRYFSGKSSATAAYTTSSTRDDALGLPRVTWSASTNPYRTGGYPVCSKPYFMLISDVYPSFDSDKLPGTATEFGSFAGDVTDLNVSTLGDSIWDLQFGDGTTKGVFIGQVGSTYDGAPTVKTASGFGNIRGLAPGEPTRQGSFYTASIAFFGKTHDLNAATGEQNSSTYSIALAPPLPTIEIPVGSGKVALVPFSKSVGGSSISAASGSFQPTNQIVDFYVDTIKNTTDTNTDATVNSGRPYYKFRINYEDVEQGADHDMDAIATYEVKLNADSTITVNLSSDYAAGGIIQHMGYVISGTTADGVYLEIRDKDTDAASDPDYFLDTPNTAGTALPLISTRTFTAGSTESAGTMLKDPLWYAAKFGGFNDANGNDKPDNDRKEWDTNVEGIPDNYFLVVNPLTMLTQMDKALAKIRDDNGTSAALSTNSFSFQSDTLIYQSRFNSEYWTGELNAYPVTASGIDGALWQAQVELAAMSSGDRVVLTYDLDRISPRGIPFTWNSMTSIAPMTLRTALNKSANGTVDTLGEDRVEFLRGSSITGMRSRPVITGSGVNKLGDIVNSQAQYVGVPNFGYGEGSFAAFSVAKAGRTKMVYVGANDGMLHGFDGSTGEELLAYVPSEMYRTRGSEQILSKLTQTDYGKAGNPHRYYVDGTPTVADICTGSCDTAATWKTIIVGGLNGGGQGIYALDITNPGNFTETNASSIVKWEFLDHDHDGSSTTSTITGDSELGYTYSRPFVVKLCTARDTGSGTTPKFCTAYEWFVIFGNGYNNTEADGHAGTGDAVLYIVNADTGTLKKKIAVGQADGANPNGMSELAPVDIDGDGTIDYIYAGDLKGNVWRFDFVSANESNWESTLGTGSTPNPLYIAKDEASPTRQRQPITTAPDVIVHPEGGVLVIFGTGSYLATTDPATTQVQTIYGIWDKMDDSTVSSTDRSNLQQQTVNTVIVTGTSTTTIAGETVTSTEHSYRTISANSVNWNTKRGWYMNLPESGERISFNPQVLGGNLLKFVSTIPSSDICSYGGDSWDYYTDALTGGRLSWSPFVDFSGVHDFGGVSAYASARKSSVGITPQGTVLTEGQGRGTVFQGGSTGRMDYYKANLGPATAGRVSWREILSD